MGKHRSKNSKRFPKQHFLSKKHWFILKIAGICLIFTSLLYFMLPAFSGLPPLPAAYLKLLLALSILTFGIFVFDKKLSYGASTRIPNSVLYGLAFMSGGVGSFAARRISRHKISDNHGEEGKNYRTKFNLIEPAAFVIHALVFLMLYQAF